MIPKTAKALTYQPREAKDPYEPLNLGLLAKALFVTSFAICSGQSVDARTYISAPPLLYSSFKQPSYKEVNVVM